MGELIEILKGHGRSFPIGLSNHTGFGYMLTGGISPLSRSQGLAIDQIEQINGIWGNGTQFVLKRNDQHTNGIPTNEWRALLGASPFLAIITSVKLRTFPIRNLRIWSSIVKPNELMDLIRESELFPNHISLQWSWDNTIKALCVIDSNNDLSILKELNNMVKDKNNITTFNVNGLDQLNNLNILKSSSPHKQLIYNEVLGILGPSWENNVNHVVHLISGLMNERPNQFCYISSQQLGGHTSKVKRDSTSFLHRNSLWKPWITAGWPASNSRQKELSLKWQEKVWKKLQPFCPDVHMAQLHQHLPFHKKEINGAFDEWLPSLQELKQIYDPKGLLPNL